MAKPSLLVAFVRGSAWPSSAQRGSACAASARRTRGGGRTCTCKRPSCTCVRLQPRTSLSARL
eukprot:14450060-Alexandrium_andersonii.AAC.1